MSDPPTHPPEETPAGAAVEPMLVAGPVSSLEELANVQQMAFVARWMRFFSGLARPGSPQA